MPRKRYYIVQGMGNDEIGLVGTITAPIASAGGNIVDLRQDVLHGLFTIYMVIDLTDCDLRIDTFKDIVKTIAEDTGLNLSVEAYHPVARDPEKRNILMILVGRDKPGIIASVSQTLANYKANIEFAQNIAREDIFLMELLIDVSHCSLPLDNLKSVITQNMSEMGITALFQTEDVFNKKKRIILFNTNYSLIPPDIVKEILKHTGISPKDIADAYPAKIDAVSCSVKAAQLLDGLSVDVLNTIARNIFVEDGTVELLQTLKIMGYKIGAVSNGFSIFLDILAQKLNIEYCYSSELPVNDDSRLVSGDMDEEKIRSCTLENFIKESARKEQVPDEDVTVISLSLIHI